MISSGPRRWAKPRRLEPGDRIALVAPASPFTREALDAGRDEIARLGFEPVVDPRVFARAGFQAGDAATRAAVLHDAWRDPSINALVAIRGGYGSAEVLPLLDPRLMLQRPKVFVGYSDVTALLWFHLQHGVVSFHGPMVDRRLEAGAAGYDRASLLAAVSRPEPAGRLAPASLDAIVEGEASGILMGGTLTQLVASLGSPWAFDPPDGVVLFIEDVRERPYRVRRMLTQLSQAGILRSTRALVFGEMPECDEPGGAPGIRDTLADFVAGFSGPVLLGFPSGHTTGPTWTLPFGVTARVVTSPPGVILEEAAVA